MAQDRFGDSIRFSSEVVRSSKLVARELGSSQVATSADEAVIIHELDTSTYQLQIGYDRKSWAEGLPSYVRMGAKTGIDTKEVRWVHTIRDITRFDVREGQGLIINGRNLVHTVDGTDKGVTEGRPAETVLTEGYHIVRWGANPIARRAS